MIFNLLTLLSLLLLSGHDFTLAHAVNSTSSTANSTSSPANLTLPTSNSSAVETTYSIHSTDDPDSPLSKARLPNVPHPRKKVYDAMQIYEPRKPDLEKLSDLLYPLESDGFPRYPPLLRVMLRSITENLWIIHKNVVKEYNNDTFAAASHFNNLISNHASSDDNPFILRDYYYGMEHVQLVGRLLLDLRRAKLIENWHDISNALFILVQNQLVLLGLLLGPYDHQLPGPKHLIDKPWDAIWALVDALVVDHTRELDLDLFGPKMLWRQSRYRSHFIRGSRGSATFDDEFHTELDP
ncbi:hypothetical protein L249_7818 [Ophiocordyceps polyrhachis-furcata BCC 54312]|uniref:Uncharacterized protein n=1 Tax=Ophiocordyceps polyrhachis-furcata BCC 54312 TaxID=1330021 RepID=A0A367L0P8_9HYPO|nr:hypothetical protein L249_7818 [Ophiocordyceps polyrhachis-furcata BCC 54312]